MSLLDVYNNFIKGYNDGVNGKVDINAVNKDALNRYRQQLAKSSSNRNSTEFLEDQKAVNFAKSGVPFQKDSSYPNFKKGIYESQNIFGLPLWMDDFQGNLSKVLQTSLIIKLIPALPRYHGLSGDKGLNLFDLDVNKGVNAIREILLNANISPRHIVSNDLMFCVLNDTSITDSFTNDFSDSQFESMAQVGSDIGSEIKVATGTRKLSDVQSQLPNLLGEELGGMMNTGINTVKSGLDKVLGANNTSIMGSLITGSKVDFPMIWKGSSYNPSYSFTCRFYNPDPESDEAYMKFILAPLAHLLAFMVPMSDSNSTFSFPLICKFQCPGLCALEAAYISQMDVIKGSEVNDISFWQRPGIVDVRFTVNSLYSTMISKSEDGINEERPTLATYINAMKGWVQPPRTATSQDMIGTVESDLDLADRVARAISRSGGVGDSDFELYRSTNGVLDSRNAARIDALNSIDKERLSVLETVISTDPVLLAQNNSYNLDPDTIANINNYKKERDQFFNDNNGSIDVGTDVALRIKYNIPVTPSVSDWFWNNFDIMKSNTKELVEGKNPPSDVDLIASEIATSISKGGKL